VPQVGAALLDRYLSFWRREAMQHLQEDSQSSHVTALFADRALSFALQKGATFEDLVCRLAFC
jgi:hypothetical protein